MSNTELRTGKLKEFEQFERRISRGFTECA